jgi:hypothetical protein
VNSARDKWFRECALVMSRNRQSLLRDFVELLRDLSMGVTEAHTVELPHRSSGGRDQDGTLCDRRRLDLEID